MIGSDQQIVALVGGTGRSGTTLMSEMLSTHTDVASVPELRFLVDPDGILDFYAASKSSWSPYVVDQRVRRLVQLLQEVSYVSHPRKRQVLKSVERLTGLNVSPRYDSVGVVRYCPDFEDHVERLETKITQFRYDARWSGSRPTRREKFRYVSPNIDLVKDALTEFLNGVYSSILTTQKKRVYLEKNTWNICWFHHMLDLFPESKLLHIVRDPRAVALSFTRQRWMPDNLKNCAQIVLDLHSEWAKHAKVISGDRYCTIRFEDLLRKPVPTMEKVFRFYELGVSDNLNFPELNLEAATSWQNHVTRQDLDWMNRFFSELLSEYDYA